VTLAESDKGGHASVDLRRQAGRVRAAQASHMPLSTRRPGPVGK
jgi:hypothetical protein